MLDSVFWGVVAALSLGTADYLARTTSNAVGPFAAFTYVVMLGTLLMAAFMLVTGSELRITKFGLVMSCLHGLCVPVSLAVPVVAAHPVLIILYEVAFGVSSLSTEQILASGLVIAGVVGTSVFSFHHDAGGGRADRTTHPRKHATLVLSLGACVAYALLVITGQAAASEMGQTSVALVGRAASAAILLAALAGGMFRLPPPSGVIRPLAAQGILDTAGYIGLLAGGSTLFPGMTAVVGSMFGFITILLARIFVREHVGLLQWSSIALSFAGVAWLVQSR